MAITKQPKKRGASKQSGDRIRDIDHLEVGDKVLVSNGIRQYVLRVARVYPDGSIDGVLQRRSLVSIAGIFKDNLDSNGKASIGHVPRASIVELFG